MSRVFAAALVVGLVSVGCGGASENAPPPEVAKPSAPPASTEVTSSTAPRVLKRDDVRATVRAGLGYFLQRIQLDPQAVFEGGRFKGFRVAALTGDPSFWSGVDLRRGDVITRVNGQSVERPEQALVVFKSLETAPELRVSLERGGQPREIVYPIEGPPEPARRSP